MTKRRQALSESESFVTTFVFQVNYVSPKPSKTGEFYVLLNPVGTAPAHQRLDGVTSVSWTIWLSSAKADEYRGLMAQAVAKSQEQGQAHRVFVSADFSVQPKPGLKPGQQTNRLTFLTKAVKEIRPVVVLPTQDELA